MEAYQIPMFDNVVQFPSSPRVDPVKRQTTSPIRDREVIESIKERLLYSSKKYGYRNYMIFLFAINTALRMGDVLQTRLQDIWDESTQSIKSECSIFEEKTDKIADIDFSDELKASLKEYILSIPDRTPFTPLFPSRKTQPKSNLKDKDDTGCLDRKSYWRILNSIGKELGVDHLACHSCRKTAAYHIYMQYKGQLVEDQFSAIDVVQEILNHSSSKTTLRYIGITPSVRKSVYKNLNL